jgi:hypothetical protein
MQSLFQPQPSTQATYDVLTTSLFSSGGIGGKLLRTLLVAMRHHAVAALIGAFVGLVLVAASIAWTGGAMLVIGIVSGVALAAIGLIALVVYAVVRRALFSLAANSFGLCNGSTVGNGELPGLTEFLADEIDILSGRDPGTDSPLTFGDLGAAGVSLSMLTTNVTQGAPLLLPDALDGYFWRPDEFRSLFPERIVTHMEANPRQPGDDEHAAEWERWLPALRMPEMENLPIIVAVRMSLSFPVLLTAVPLWTVDFSGEAPSFERDWLSDGGITSNFPVHFFDSPLPSRPTFAINLAQKESLSSDETKNVFFPRTTRQGLLRRRESISGIVGFIRSILNTMQNWADTEQMRVPGYRDRVATIFHTKEEGGLNLNMTEESIRSLDDRGRLAGAVFNTEFDFEQHRWIRYRLVMAVIEDYLSAYEQGWNATPMAHGKTYAELIPGPDPDAYRSGWSGPKVKYFKDRTEDLVNLASNWPDPAETHSFGKGAPRPEPSLRVTPQSMVPSLDDDE